MTDKNDSPIIWYIPGLYSADDPQEKAVQLLQMIYPNAEEIVNVAWECQNGDNVSLNTVVSSGVEKAFNDSNPLKGLLKLALGTVGSISERWINALDDVEPTAQWLANLIANNLTSSQRQNLILIGHSLGGNIIIRTLAHLSYQNLSIKSAVLLGAAIENMNRNILLAMEATQKPISSMVNPDDTALKVFQTVTGCRALGTGCDLKYDHSKFHEHYTSSHIGHSSAFYLSQWAEVNNVKKDFDESPLRLLENVAGFLGINRLIEKEE
ncbi:MAG: alpha/beta hydrolase [Thermoguttaceae bacterium]|nr:alpha/beta hydrolase [Thermoguttaceae bacterium]